MRIDSRSHRLKIALIGFTIGWSHAGRAIDLSWQPQLRVGVRATDNVRWTSASQEAALGFDNGGGAVLKAESTDWRSTITPSFNFRRFAIGQNLDADEYGVRSQHQWSATERLQTSLQVDYARDSTLTSELTDAGRQNVVANRDTVTVQPGLTYLLNETTVLNASFLYTDVAFSSGGDSGLVGYTYKQVSLSGTHFLSDKLQMFVTGFISDFDVPDIGSKTRTYGAQTGVTYQYSSDVTMDLAGGYVKSGIDFLDRFFALVFDPFPRIVQIVQPGEASSSGPIASASIRKTFENMRTRLDYVRRVSPSIRGAQTIEDDIAVSVDRDITRHWLLGFKGGYNMRGAESQDVGGNIGELNRDQALLSGSVAYQFTREISLRSEYRFTRQTITDTNETIYVNAFFLTLNYNGEPRLYRGY